MERGAIGGLPAVFLLLLGLWNCADLWNDTFLTEAALTRQFKRSREQLDRLQRMVEEDRLQGRVHAEYVDNKRLSAARVGQYREMMRAADILRIWAEGPGKPTEFLVDAVGALDVGVYKGFLHSQTDESPAAASLDVSCLPRDTKVRSCRAVERLDGNWWLVRYEFN